MTTIRLTRAACIFAMTAISTQVAAYTDSGDVVEINNDLLIGNTAFGQRDYGSGGGDTKDIIRLGISPGIRGEILNGFTTSTVLTEVGGQGDGYYSGYALTTPQLIVGSAAGSTGRVDVLFGIINGTGSGSACIVGDAGSGSIRLGDGPDSTTMSFDQVTLGARSGGTGSIWVDSGSLSVGSTSAPGHLIIGKGGSGSVGVYASKASVDVHGTGARVEIGAESTGNGSISLSHNGYLFISGNDSRLVIGGEGRGTAIIGEGGFEGNGLGFYGVTGGESFVGMLPGSHGEVQIGFESSFNAGEVLRIGLDENDNPGGTGTVMLTYGYGTLIAGDIRLGPNGSLKTENPATVRGNIDNQGLISGSFDFSGSIVNSGVITFDPANFLPSNITVMDFTQIASGTTKLRDYMGQVDRIHATGSADVDGVIDVSFDPDAGPSSNYINLITADAGLTVAPSLSVVTHGLQSYQAVQTEIGPNTLDLRIVAADLDADLVVSQVDTPDPVKVGENITYRVDVINNGPGIASNFALSGAIPQGATFISVEPSFACTHSAGEITCSLDQLYPPVPSNPDANTFTMLLTVRPTVAGILTHSVSVASSATDPSPADNAATETTTVLNTVSDLVMSVADQTDPVIVNDELIYTLTATNNGPDSASNVGMSVDLPDSALFVSATTTQGACSGADPVTCALGTLAANEQVAVEVRVKPQTPGDISVSASVDSSSSDPNTDNNTAVEGTTVEPEPLPVANLAVSMVDTPDPAHRNQDLQYHITVTNNGPDVAADVTLTDILPSEMTLRSATSSQGSCVGAAPVVCSLGDLAPGTSTTVDVVVNPEFGGTWTNVVSVSSGAQDPDTDNNSVIETTTVRGRPFKPRI